MNFRIRGRRVELTETLLAHVERHLRFALGRFGPRITQTAVKLTDLNGPRGGFDKQCQITVTLTPSGKVIVEAADTDFHAAIDRALNRAERSVARELERRRSRAT